MSNSGIAVFNIPNFVKLNDTQTFALIDWGTRGRIRSHKPLSTFSKNFGDMIRLARVGQGVTQKDLASAIGLSRQELLSKIETGRQECPAWVVNRIAQTLGRSNAYQADVQWFSWLMSLSSYEMRQAINAARREAGLSPKELADRAGVFLLWLEGKGHRDPKMLHLWAFAMALGKKPDFILAQGRWVSVTPENCWIAWAVMVSHKSGSNVEGRSHTS